jgi:hypothetical protein
MGKALALLLVAGCSGGTCDLSTGIIGACDYRMGMSCYAANQPACLDWHDEQDSFNHVTCTCGTQDLYKAGVACDSTAAIGYCLYESFGKSCQVGWYFQPAGLTKDAAQQADSDNCTTTLKGKFTAL